MPRTPLGGAYDAPSDPLVGWEGGYPRGGYSLPITHPLDAFGVSFLTPLARAYLDPPQLLKAGAAPAQNADFQRFISLDNVGKNLKNILKCDTNHE